VANIEEDSSDVSRKILDRTWQASFSARGSVGGGARISQRRSQLSGRRSVLMQEGR
jgi:hypothetical protein